VPRPLLFLTGFGPFADIPANPSGEMARALQGQTIGGAEIRSCVLPVSFRSMPAVYAGALAALADAPLVALCSLGVQREATFRLERRARPRLDSTKADVEGAFAAEYEPLGASERRTTADLESLARAMGDGAGLGVRISEDAGGYLCERCYWDVLGESARRGVPGVFLHVPPPEALALEDQLGPVRALLEELAREGA